MPDPFYADDAVTIWHGDARALPLDDASVDLIVTSPPYFSLRSYKDGGEHYAGQLGSEASPAEFVDALVEVTRECVRVLKPSGSLWVNLGDKYAERAGPPRPGGVDDDDTARRPADRPARGRRGDVPVKSLMGLPWRYAIRCVDDLGLILRAEIVWAKLNPMPESVTDRVRRTHETWFHFTPRASYYAAIDEIREPHAPETAARARAGFKVNARRDNGATAGNMRAADVADGYDMNPLGKLPGSVWQIATQPLAVPPEVGVAHYAAFPMEWPRRIIRGWSPSGICTACGEGRRPITHRVRTSAAGDVVTGAAFGATRTETADGRGHTFRTDVTITGEACACPEPTAPIRPAVVLDPFGGTGTTGLVARALGRRAHLVDLSADYCRLARWRVTDPGERARALEVPKPPPPPAGVDALFELTPPDPTERSA